MTHDSRASYEPRPRHSPQDIDEGYQTRGMADDESDRRDWVTEGRSSTGSSRGRSSTGRKRRSKSVMKKGGRSKRGRR